MAPTLKREIEDDFIFTISDNEEEGIPNLDDEVELTPPPASKKRKHTSDPGHTASEKKKKKVKKENYPESGAVGDSNEGIWGQKDEDDGAMDPDFEFALESVADERLDEFEG